jgi:virginiamycin B lyase
MRRTAVLLMACVMAALTVTSATAVGEAAPDSKCAPGATVEEFAVPTPGAGPIVITVGPDSNRWFTEFNAGKIARMRENGRITEFPIPTPDSRPDGIAAGPDDNLWFAEVLGNKIGRSTIKGEITEFLVPTGDSRPTVIERGRGETLWFSERGTAANPGEKIGGSRRAAWSPSSRRRPWIAEH